MIRLKRLFSALLSVMMIVSLTFGTAWGATPWNAQIRPGVIAGTEGQSTDFNTDFLFPLAGDNKYIFFFNPNVRFDDNSGNEQNIGFGYRRLLSGDKAIVGVNAYYDFMKSTHGNHFEQFGLGAEVLSEWVDFRANYYNPLGTKKHRMTVFDKYDFESSSLVFRKGYEEALRGFDAEVGVLVPGISKVIETRIFGGGFWYDSDVASHVKGWRGRLEIMPSKLLNLNAEVRHDNYRGTDTFIGAYLNIPFSLDELGKGGSPFKGLKEAAAFGKGARTLSERMVEKVVRDRNIVSIGDASRSNSDIDYSKSKDMIYVSQDNTDDPAQNGTFEHPWESVEAAEAGELAKGLNNRWKETAEGVWVYVFHKDRNHLTDLTAHTYEDNHTELANNMVLWGEGYYIPEFRLGGLNGAHNPAMNPILNGSGTGSVITLANHNEIMGFTIQNGAPHGISGTNIKSASIHDNIIRDNAQQCSGIHIENNFAGAGLSAGETFSYMFANNTLSNNEGSGIYLKTIVNGDTNINGLTINNVFTNNKISGTYDGNGLYGTAIKVENDIDLSWKKDGPIDEDLSLSINNVNINNTFTDNRIFGDLDQGVAGNRGTGIKVDNSISTYLEVGADNLVSLYDGGTVESRITNSHINNTFTGNEINDENISGASGYHNGIRISNNINAEAFLSDDLSESGTVIANVSGSAIRNSLTDNKIKFSSFGSTGIYINNNISSHSNVEEVDGVSGPVAASISSSVSDSGITNELTNNDVIYAAGLSGDGIYMENTLLANDQWEGLEGGIYDVYDGAVAEVTASVINSYINNLVSGSDITYADNSDNGDAAGISIYSDMHASTYAAGGAEDIRDQGIARLAAKVTGSHISNALNANAVTYNDGQADTGIDMYSLLHAYTEFSGENGLDNVYSGGVVSLTSTVADSYISNVVGTGVAGGGNRISYYSGSGTGIDIYNSLYAESVIDEGIQELNENASSPYNMDTAANLTAEVKHSGISNELTNNEVLFDGAETDGAGIYIYNGLYAYADAATDYNGIRYIYDGAEVKITAAVTNDDEADSGSSISNTLSGNKVSYTDGAYGNGIYAENDLYASIYSADEGGIYGIYDAVGVTMDSAVSAAQIMNTLAGNTVTYGSGSGSDNTGIEVVNGLFATIEFDGRDIREVYDYSEVKINAAVADSRLSSTLTGNTVEYGSESGGTGISLANNLFASQGLNYDRFYGIEDIAGIVNHSRVNLTASVTGSHIDNMLEGLVNGENITGNTVTYQEDSFGSAGILITSELYAFQAFSGEIYDVAEGAQVNISSTVANSHIANSVSDSAVHYKGNTGSDITGIYIANNIDADIDMDYYWEEYDLKGIAWDGSADNAEVKLTSLVKGSYITNTLAGNEVSFAGGSDTVGLRIDNELDSYIWMGGADIEEVYGNGQVRLSASVEGSYVENRLTGNTVSLDGSETSNGLELANYLHATIQFEDIQYDISNSALVELSSSVLDSYIDNTVSEDNSVIFTNGAGGTGIGIYNDIYADIWPSDEFDYSNDLRGIYDDATINLTASVSGSHIYNTVSDNTVSYGAEGYGTAVDMGNFITANISVHDIYDIYGSGSPSINLTASVEHSAIENAVSGNTITTIDGTGIDISNAISAQLYVDYVDIYDGQLNLNAHVYDSGVINDLGFNSITGNGGGGDGIHIGNSIRVDTAVAYLDNGDYDLDAYSSYVSIANNLTSGTDSVTTTPVAVSGYSGYGVRIENGIVNSAGDVAHAEIGNSADGMTITGNGADGLKIDNRIDSYAGSVTTAIESNTLNNNVISGNTGQGLHITSDSDEAVAVSVVMYHNEVFNNGSYGVYIDNVGSAGAWSIDLGQFATSLTAGHNSFYGNNGAGAEVFNNSGYAGAAMYNYWNGAPSYSGDFLDVSEYYLDAAFTTPAP